MRVQGRRRALAAPLFLLGISLAALQLDEYGRLSGGIWLWISSALLLLAALLWFGKPFRDSIADIRRGPRRLSPEQADRALESLSFYLADVQRARISIDAAQEAVADALASAPRKDRRLLIRAKGKLEWLRDCLADVDEDSTTRGRKLQAKAPGPREP